MSGAGFFLDTPPEHDLASAVREFQTRERRFGGVPEPVAVSTGSWLD